MRDRLCLSEFPAASEFLRTYADPTSNGALAQWFHYSPHVDADLSARIEELRARPQANRVELAAQLATAQEQYGGDEAAVANARRLAELNTFTVVTGQQVGLLGGPVFCQLKAISAVKLARRLSAQFPDCNFVPVFWLATSDSDFEEVRRTHLLNRQGELRTIELPQNGTHWDNELIGERSVGEYLPDALRQAYEELPGGEHRDEVYAALAECYAADRLSSGFARWMARLFRGTGLVLCDSLLLAVHEGLGPLAVDVLARYDEYGAALAQRDAEISAAGFAPQVTAPAGETLLFHVEEGRREKIVLEDGGFALRSGEKHFTRDALLGLAAEHPWYFANSALLTPLLQDVVLRPAAFLGGGAELAYRAQSSALADLHGVKLAPAYLRATATLLPQKSMDTLNELDWQLSDLYRGQDEVIKAAIAKEKPEEIAQALEEYLATLHSADAKLRTAAVAFDPALEETFETLRGNLIRHLEKLDKKITASLKHRAENLVRRVTTVHNQAYPHQHVQERQLSLLSFLPRYGFSLIEDLIEKLEVPCWEHQVITL